MTTNGKAKFLGGRVTKGYTPTVVGGAGMWFFGDEPLYLTWWEVERMLRDPQVDFALRVLRAPVQTAQWEVKCKRPDVARFVDSTLKTLWKHDLWKVLAYLSYGYSGGEVLYKEENGLIQFDSLVDFHPADLAPLELKGKLCGVSVKGLSTNAARKNRGKVYITSPRFWYCAHEPRFGMLFGRSRLVGMWLPWKEKRDPHAGACQLRLKWYTKNAYHGGRMWHPDEAIITPEGREVPAQELARQGLELYESGGTLALPNTRDEAGNKKWEYEDPKLNGAATDIREYVKDLDLEILKGGGIPPEVVQASGESGSGYAGRSIPALVFYTSEDALVDTTIASLDRQIVKWLVRVNYGNVPYLINPKSLVPSPQEEGQGEGPQEGGGLPGMKAAAPGMSQPPGPDGAVQMALDSDRSEKESASPLVDALIDRSVAAGLSVSEETRRKVRAALKKKFPGSVSSTKSGAS